MSRNPHKTVAEVIEKITKNVKATFGFLDNADDILESVVGSEEDEDDDETEEEENE